MALGDSAILLQKLEGVSNGIQILLQLVHLGEYLSVGDFRLRPLFVLLYSFTGNPNKPLIELKSSMAGAYLQ